MQPPLHGGKWSLSAPVGRATVMLLPGHQTCPRCPHPCVHSHPAPESSTATQANAQAVISRECGVALPTPPASSHTWSPFSACVSSLSHFLSHPSASPPLSPLGLCTCQSLWVKLLHPSTALSHPSCSSSSTASPLPAGQGHAPWDRRGTTHFSVGVLAARPHLFATQCFD